MAGWQTKRCYFELKDRSNNGRRKCHTGEAKTRRIKFKMH